MAATLTLSVIEIVVLLFGAIILGITIHFFIASRPNLKIPKDEASKPELARNEWKLKYFNDMELRDREITTLKRRVEEAEENLEEHLIEAEELRRSYKNLKTASSAPVQTDPDPALQQAIQQLQEENRQLREALQNNEKHAAPAPADPAPDGYLEQLREAQQSLLEQNKKISQLLGNIDVIKEKEEIKQEMLKANEELAEEIDLLRHELTEKENEIIVVKKKEHLTKEMSSMLDTAYEDFQLLQEKIRQLEMQLTSSKMMNIEYEDLKEAHRRLSRDMDGYRQKNQSLVAQNQELQVLLEDTLEKAKTAEFQRQQLQKKISYLEELNHDLHVVSDVNKKLEGQLRRIGELESMLNVVSEERDILAGRQVERNTADDQ